jgi:hypothetical protein
VSPFPRFLLHSRPFSLAVLPPLVQLSTRMALLARIVLVLMIHNKKF